MSMAHKGTGQRRVYSGVRCRDKEAQTRSATIITRSKAFCDTEYPVAPTVSPSSKMTLSQPRYTPKPRNGRGTSGMEANQPPSLLRQSLLKPVVAWFCVGRPSIW